MSAVTPALEDLKRRRPEWTPWLTVVQEAMNESGNPAWDAVVPVRSSTLSGAPALEGAAVTIPGKLAGGFFERLAAAAARAGTPKLVAAAGALRAGTDPAALFQASLTQDLRQVDEIASSSGVDPDALEAIVTLVALPFLQACGRRWSGSNSPAWAEGYCQICGSWPSFAEMRGVERSRFHRCGRCGGEWYAQILQCVYCRTTEHEELVALVPEQAGGKGTLDACRRCKGYVKAFTRLQGCAPSAVMLHDLASVDLDVAALEAGYTRPPGAGCSLAVSVEVSAGRRFLAWNA